MLGKFLCTRRRSYSQSTQQEHEAQRDTLHHGNLQPPYLLDRQAENGDVRQDVGDGVCDKGRLEVDTGAVDPRHVRLRHGRALEHADQDDRDPPADGEEAENHGRDLEAARREDTTVHQEQGDLDEHDCRDIDALKGQKQLEELHLLVPRESRGMAPETLCNHYDAV